MFNIKRDGPLAAVPGVEAVPQAENTIRLAVRYPCGCMRTRDIQLSQLDGLDRYSLHRFLGEKMVETLEKLNNETEHNHGGSDPLPY